MTDLNEIRFFQTANHKCGYLENKEASNVFIDPHQEIDAGIFSALSEYGFRRSGDHVYRPHCGECSACTPIRVITEEFYPSKSQRRCIKKNEDLSITMLTSIDDEEYYDLYQRYINERHSDGDMYPATREQYDNFLSNQWGVTRYLAFRDSSGALLSVAVCDLLQNGVSAMYSFFSPTETSRSLGVFNILYIIQWAREQELPYIFLGYWIKGCQKMEYKMQYQPCQVYINNIWSTFTP